MNEGIYEKLITNLVREKITELQSDVFFVKEKIIDKEEAVKFLTSYLANSIKLAFGLFRGEGQVEKQIELANKLLVFLSNEISNESFERDLIEAQGKILQAVFSKLNAPFNNLDKYLKEITPYTRLSHSELFTGGNAGLSLESEIRKEILSSNRIDFLVSFIKFKGVITLKKELEEFTNRGGELRIITSTYMGASDYKAILMLSKMKNTSVKISYNTKNERLHAKAYLFKRNTGFDTGYIGSSNFSRSALTDGLEWNVKVTTSEVGHLIDKFQKTFESYWQNDEFELFDDSKHSEKLVQSLSQTPYTDFHSVAFFDLKPYPYQTQILEKLEVERDIHNRNRNLIVAATGTGKTMISAFDFKKFLKLNGQAKLLFIAHRKEILIQSRSTFQAVLKDANFGELMVDGMVPNDNRNVFGSVQSLNNRIDELQLSKEYYDFIIIDEVHHIAASSYRKVLEYFEPKILLGLTATPERMDGGDILSDFGGKIAAEIRLPEALNRKLLCPFQYFGISDSIDLSEVSWVNGRYSQKELTELYTANNIRVGEIINTLDKYTKDNQQVKALAFCASIEHSKYMSEKFNDAGLNADYLNSTNSKERNSLKNRLSKGEINYLFVVDIFNEGVDIPEIDTVLFLRPTESLTIFLQQLGRGLRLADDKESLTVLDFVGNARPEYNFESKFRALIGKTQTSVSKEIEDDFPHLPLGCSIVLEKKSKDAILQNIKAATSLNRRKLIENIRNFKHNSTQELSLSNFLNFYELPIQTIYSKGSWKRLCQLAGCIEDFSDSNEKQTVSAISKKWLSSNSLSYFQFIRKLALNNFEYKFDSSSKVEQTMALMLHYDYWQIAGGFSSLEESINQMGKNTTLNKEIVEVLDYLIDSIDFKEMNIDLHFAQPLKVHSRYTRDQILTAFEFSTFDKKASNREGVAENKDRNIECLFINLFKSEENYSPTTMYDDYAINEVLFHWQSQNSSTPEKGKGLSYINHVGSNKKILLFVREKNKDQFGNTMGYVFLGEATLKDYSGAKPMNIEWELREPIPNYILKDSAKMQIG